MSGCHWHSLVFNPKPYIDIEKPEDVKQSENYNFEEISKEWENFENEIMIFVTRCKSFFGKLGSLK
jgi:hypothetical protein